MKELQKLNGKKKCLFKGMNTCVVSHEEIGKLASLVIDLWQS